MNAGLLILLIIPLLGAADTPPQNVPDLAEWLKLLNGQQVETLNGLGNTVNHIVLDTAEVFAVVEILVKLTNGTSQQNVLLQEDIEILKGRLAIAAIFSSVYMIISTLCLIGYLVVLVKKSVKKHQLKRQEEEVELMDQRLQEKRERRRAAARAKSGSPRQQ